MKPYTVFLLGPEKLDPRELKSAVDDLLAESGEQLSEGEVQDLAAEIIAHQPPDEHNPMAGEIFDHDMLENIARELKLGDDAAIARFPERAPQDGDFVWQTDKKQLMKPSEMATPHLFFTVRMIWNHSVPAAFRVGKFINRGPIGDWPTDYRVQASNAMLAELDKRSDLEDFMVQELNDIQSNNDFIDMVMTGVKRMDPLDYELTETDREIIAEKVADKMKGYLLPERKKAKAKKVRKHKAKAKVHAYPYKVRGYTRADGSKVRGYKRG